ncbi:hypothetical protein ARMSODRAFT_980539 [Armillaria solidipes]|uniref:Uncharacterized protein n=1 Tax=Armillaria solidipes TaxID=1076256 RepID=A0A2H3AYW4_9AGAR|nr:hypothetical protein ARMSODRAFT_980539 [Armillaria solidipes]
MPSHGSRVNLLDVQDDRDAPGDVEGVEEYWLWVSYSFCSGLMCLNVVWSRLLRMAEVRGVTDAFYETQLQALKREVIRWNLWTSANTTCGLLVCIHPWPAEGCPLEVKIIDCGIWHLLYCLLSSVQKLLICHMEIQVGMDGQDSVLDDTWHADHGLMHLIDLPIEPVPEYACVLTKLAIYNAGFHTYSNFACIVNNLVGPLEEQLLNGSEIYKLTLGFGTFGMSVHDLTLGANDDEEEEILSLEHFKHLDVLRFEVDLTSGSFAWTLQKALANGVVLSELGGMNQGSGFTVTVGRNGGSSLWMHC